jgi:hypothetical protein
MKDESLGGCRCHKTWEFGSYSYSSATTDQQFMIIIMVHSGIL